LPWANLRARLAALGASLRAVFLWAEAIVSKNLHTVCVQFEAKWDACKRIDDSAQNQTDLGKYGDEFGSEDDENATRRWSKVYLALQTIRKDGHRKPNDTW